MITEPCVLEALRVTCAGLSHPAPFPLCGGQLTLRAILLQSGGTGEDAAWQPYSATTPAKHDDGVTDDDRLAVLIVDGADRLIGYFWGRRGVTGVTFAGDRFAISSWWRNTEHGPAGEFARTRDGVGPMVKVCSWCPAEQSTRLGLPLWLRVTHGMCPACAARVEEDLPPIDVLTDKPRSERWFKVEDQSPARDEERSNLPEGEVLMTPISWDELAAVNESDTMEEIASLKVGEKTILGQCDPIERVS